ncbi:MAG: hypothetical protein ABIP03_05385 [Aquihabitans sp.]
MSRTANTRLALRVVAGTDRAGSLRVAVLVVAMAVAVAAGLVIAFVPAIAAHRTEAAAARAVQSTRNPDAERFRATAVDAAVGDRPLRRIFIAAPHSSPLAPGADRVPESGQVLASPALRELLEDEPFVKSFVPGEVVGTVSAAGLTDPEELFAYVGVDATADLRPAAGFGGQTTLEGGAWSFVALQLAVFVLVPSGGFLVVASTLSSRARSRRWDAMRSVSVPEATIRHVAAIETGLTSAVGGVVGLGLFALVRIPLTSDGFGGLRWFPADLRLTPRIVVATVLLVAGAGTLLGRRATRIHSVDSLHDHGGGVHLALRGLPLACGVAMLSTTVLVRQTGRVVNSAPILLVGALLSVLGLGLVLVPLVRASGEVVAHRSRHLAWRLGGQRAAYEPRSVVRILAGLVTLTVVGYLTFAVLADLRVAVGSDLGRVVAKTSARDVPAARVDEFLGLRPISVAIGSTPFGANDRASIAYLHCDVLVRVATTLAPCRPGSVYRVRDRKFPSDLEAGHTYQFATQAGDTLAIDAPTASATDRVGLLDTSTILVAGEAPSSPLAIEEVRYLVDRDDLVGLQSSLARLDPRATIDTGIEVEKIQGYDQHLAIARVGGFLGGLLATLCFVVASVDRLLERRSHTATLVAIGVPRRVLRTSQIAQLLVPMAAALVVANLVGWLIGQSYLAMGGIVPGIAYALLAQGLGLSTIALLVAGAVGAIVSIPADIVTHLHAE